MAERIQLKEPGSEFVMAVSKVANETVEGIEYFLFTNGQKELLVPVTSVRSQLERLGISDDNPFDIAGMTVRFSRSTKLSKYGKSFWNLDLASGAEQSAGGEMGKPNAGTQSATPPVDSASDKPKLSDIYLKATEFVIDKVLPKYVAAGIGVSDTAIVAAVATLFIAASKER